MGSPLAAFQLHIHIAAAVGCPVYSLLYLWLLLSKLALRVGVATKAKPEHSLPLCSSAATVKTQIIGLCAMWLELPPLVRSGVFFLFFFMSRKGAEQPCFCSAFRSYSKAHSPII